MFSVVNSHINRSLLLCCWLSGTEQSLEQAWRDGRDALAGWYIQIFEIKVRSSASDGRMSFRVDAKTVSLLNFSPEPSRLSNVFYGRMPAEKIRLVSHGSLVSGFILGLCFGEIDARLSFNHVKYALTMNAFS